MLSIIIPTRNAATTLSATLDAVFVANETDLEIIVVDGGSTDSTHKCIKDKSVNVIETKAGRGRQLAKGATHSNGDWMLFLHADTRLPKDWVQHVRQFMTDPINTQRAAYFKLRFDDSSYSSRRVAALANWRANMWNLPYGDQGLLISRHLYEEIGGFRKDLRIMEDVNMVQRLGPLRLVPLAAYVVTCADKYRQGGWWARPIRNIFCLILFLVGVPPAIIERFYS